MNYGWSRTKGHSWDKGRWRVVTGCYEVELLPNGKNPLVGSTDKDDHFTCVELEVFALY